MKTIKDIATEAGVSKTSIYNLIKKNNVETFKRDGKTYIDESAENLIIAYYSTDQQATLDDIITDAKQTTDNNFKDDLQQDFNLNKEVETIDFLKVLENQLNEKDKTIQALINVISCEKNYQMARLLADNNNGFSNESNNTTASDQPIKKSFFSRLFNL